MISAFTIGGFFHFQCFDKYGNLKWEDIAKNAFTTVGLNHVLDTEYHGTSQSATWYIGLIRDDNYSALAAGDTMASHAGWEEGDEYDEATRPAWTEGAAAAGVMTNAVRVDFTMNATEIIKGAFLVDDNTISGSAGTLSCTALYDGGDQPVDAGDTLKAKYTLTAAAA